jgi:hypothetical protein
MKTLQYRLKHTAVWYYYSRLFLPLAANVYRSRMWSVKPSYCDVYATNKTGSSSDDWIYYQLFTHALRSHTDNTALSLLYTIYSSLLRFSSTTNFLLSYLLPRTYLELLRVTSSWTELSSYRLVLNWTSSGTRYITAAQTTQKTSPPPLLQRMYWVIA